MMWWWFIVIMGAYVAGIFLVRYMMALVVKLFPRALSAIAFDSYTIFERTIWPVMMLVACLAVFLVFAEGLYDNALEILRRTFGTHEGKKQ